MRRSSVDQVQKWEEVDPDQVDEMPVQRRVVDRPEVLGTELAAYGSTQDPEPGDDARPDVAAGHPRDEEVDAEERADGTRWGERPRRRLLGFGGCALGFWGSGRRGGRLG